LNELIGKEEQTYRIPSSSYLELLLSKPTIVNSLLASNASFSWFQFLLTQRPVNPSDWHSGQLCFPGGKCEPGENVVQAACREFHEEMGTPVEGNAEVCGIVNREYFVYFKKDKEVTISNVIAVWKGDDSFNVNPSEVEEYFWVDFNIFFKYHGSNLHKKELRSRANIFLASLMEPSLRNQIKDDLMKINLSYSTYFLTLPNDHVLWGFTMMMLSTIVEACAIPEMDRPSLWFSQLFIKRARQFELSGTGDLENLDALLSEFKFLGERRASQFALSSSSEKL